MTSNLYKEAIYSGLLGGAICGLYPVYARQSFHEKVSSLYYQMKQEIALNPALGKEDDDDYVVKNFGPSRWMENDVDRMEDIETDNAQMNPLFGAELEAGESKRRVMEAF
jgi:hypothetical protein